MPLNVVAAVQAPTLLNILSKSPAWNLLASKMGDHEGLAECAALTVPLWDEKDPAPEIVLVCSPAHLPPAKRRWPKAKIVWVVHNGRERGLLPPEHEDKVAGVLVFSERLRWLCQAGRRPRFHFISPAYEVARAWTWAPNNLWTLRNRPDTRNDNRANIFAAITQGSTHTFYGQGQDTEFADETKKAGLRNSCSAYVSALDRAAGFGLAEHEAMAAGVPLIGGWWGDMGEELSPDYWGLQYDLRKMYESTQRVAKDAEGAEELSALGCEYIAKYRTPERMDQTIQDLLKAL